MQRLKVQIAIVMIFIIIILMHAFHAIVRVFIALIQPGTVVQPVQNCFCKIQSVWISVQLDIKDQTINALRKT
jgi:hypothetical protein